VQIFNNKINNMKSTYFLYSFIIIFLCAVGGACTKYLDVKPDYRLKTPASIADLQAMLDEGNRVNSRGLSFDETSMDDYFLPENVYNSLPALQRAAYTWQVLDYQQFPNDWSNTYDVVNISNIVLDNIEKMERNITNAGAWDNVKGSAMFIRANTLLHASWVFCNAWDAASADTDFGLALKTTSDMNAATTRSSLTQTYEFILNDLRVAATLLPPLPIHPMRPSRAAAFGVLARAFMSMRQYDSCNKYANLALSIKNDLMDFNTINLTARKPFNRHNIEVVYDIIIANASFYCSNPSYANVIPEIIESYDDNDLRKTGYFTANSTGYYFKGNYSNSLFDMYRGLTTDELYLMRAESRARNGDTEDAISDLNTLLQTRWVTGEFIPYEATNANEALLLILKERRKELLWRGLRWMDIKRLNKEGKEITLKRITGDQTYTLEPNSPYYALPIPDDIIQMTGIPQNPD